MEATEDRSKYGDSDMFQEWFEFLDFPDAWSFLYKKQNKSKFGGIASGLSRI